MPIIFPGESKATLTSPSSFMPRDFKSYRALPDEATSSDEYLEDTDTAGDEHNDEHQTRVLAGYKAALHSNFFFFFDNLHVFTYAPQILACPRKPSNTQANIWRSITRNSCRTRNGTTNVL
jgi:hypothetical protein